MDENRDDSGPMEFGAAAPPAETPGTASQPAGEVTTATLEESLQTTHMAKTHGACPTPWSMTAPSQTWRSGVWRTGRAGLAASSKAGQACRQGDDQWARGWLVWNRDGLLRQAGRQAASRAVLWVVEPLRRPGDPAHRQVD